MSPDNDDDDDDDEWPSKKKGKRRRKKEKKERKPAQVSNDLASRAFSGKNAEQFSCGTHAKRMQSKPGFIGDKTATQSSNKGPSF